MQPREIPEVVKSIEDNVSIPKVFFRAFTEKQVCLEINKFISETNYSHYIISADDIVYEKDSCNAVIEKSEQFHSLGQLKVVTGWCNMFLDKDGKLSDMCNLCFKPLSLQNSSYPVLSDYSFEKTHEQLKREGDFETFLSSFAFSSFPREIILKYGMDTYLTPSGIYCSSDHNLSYRMYLAEGLSATTNRGMFFRHLKRHIVSPLKKHWLVGKEQPKIILGM
jgi:hypothetical protein